MSRRVGRWVYALTAVIMPVLLVFSLAILLHKQAIQSIYRNVDDISDGEMPATVTSFQSGPEVVSTIGGSGEGVNCSLPPIVNVFFDGSKDEEGKRHLVLQRFRQACVFHDLCYRHGLATYGYNQNDCDRVLQNEAFRLCLYIRNSRAADQAERCQTDSKMVLAGVSLGGAGAYRAWDRSTYFEFESDPSRSNGFLVSRVVDHPFKSVDPAKYRDDPDQVILTFENIRSSLTVTCVTCKKVPILHWTRDPNDVTPEYRSVGFNTLPEALLKHQDQLLSETNAVWLPPRRRHAAPHLLVDGTGKNHLIWMSRNNPGDTMNCVVITDAAKLLTHTLPREDYCATGAAARLTMVEVDMFATSPLPMEVPGTPEKDRIYATSLSAQITTGRELSFCSRSASRPVDRNDGSNDDQAKCHTFFDSRISKGAGLGAFQNFAIVRPGQQIFFARDLVLPSDSLLESARQRILGETYSPSGIMLAIDLGPPPSTKKPLTSTIQKMVPFKIDDRFDPMMPITRAKDDLRFLSLLTSDTAVSVHMTDFSKDNPAVGKLTLTMNGSPVDLHPSWALRPVLVLETREATPKTKLVFSRGEIAIDPDKPIDPAATSEVMGLETLVFERDAAASDKPFQKAAAASCTVTYEFKTNSDFPCYRAFDPKRPMRASPATRMQASQLLVGHFAGHDGQGIAFPDSCRQADPIILQPKGDTFVQTVESIGKGNELKRKVTCVPLNSNADVSGPLKQPKPPDRAG
ncbi:MAG: hypothetical protein J0H42_32400 [Rhizobiales bacterium]|nr:hypothetical protein [Hyphomicrobiales bacterium]